MFRGSLCFKWVGIAELVQWLATGWTVQGSNPCGGRDFAHLFQTGPGAHPISCIAGARAFLGVKRSGCHINHPPSSSAKVKERVELYLCYPSVPLWHVISELYLSCALLSHCLQLEIKVIWQWVCCSIWKALIVNSYVCFHSTSSSSDCCSEWGQGEERRLRDHIGKLKTERSTVRGTVVELESCHSEPVVSRQPISLAEARKLDLETAVLMQVCLYVI